jgi:hypothetical protein
MTSWKKYGFAATVLLGTILSAAIFASASPVIYNVDRIIGAGSVTGFIETDGVTGVLTAADFVDWNLLLFDGTSTFTLLGPLSGNNSAVFVQGADTEAFGTYLLFNFSGIDNGVFLFQQGLFSGNHYYCDASQPSPCVLPGETVVPLSVMVGYQNADLHGVMVIGTTAGTTPEPGSCALLLTGAGLVFSNRRLLARRMTGP